MAFTVGVFGTPDVPQGVAAPDRVQSNLPTPAQQLGQTLTGEAQQYRNIEMHANSLAAEDKVNQLVMQKVKLTVDPQNGYAGVMGANVRPENRESKQSLSEEFTGKMQQTIEDLASKLENPEQKAMFLKRAGMINADFQHGLLFHQTQQVRADAAGIVGTTWESAPKNVGADPMNETLISTEIQRINAAAASGIALGMSGPEVDFKRKEALSNLHFNAVEGRIGKGYIQQAKDYLASLPNGSIDSNRLMTLDSKFKAFKDGAAIMGIVGGMRADYDSSINQSNFTRLATVAGLGPFVVQQESGGNPNAVSPKGALGSMQVMEKTGPDAAKMAGLQWDPDLFKKNDKYRTALGNAYLNQQLQDFKGDAAKALAAYNAGPTATRTAIDMATQAGKPDDWLDYFSSKNTETKKYVTSIVGQWQSQYIPPPIPDIHEMKKKAWEACKGDLNLWHSVEPEIDKFHTEIKTSITDRGDRALNLTMLAVNKNGGNFAAVDPTITRDIPGTHLETVKAFAANVANGKDIVTPKPLYAQLSDDATLQKLTDIQFSNLQTQLSPDDFKHFTSERKRVLTGTGANLPSDLNSPEIKGILNPQLDILGFQTDPAKRDTAAEAKYGATVKAVNDDIRRAQLSANPPHKFTGKELETQIHKTLAWMGTVKNNVFSDESKPVVTMDLGELNKAYPTVVDQIRAQFKKQLQSPTDAQLVAATQQVLAVERARAEAAAAALKEAPPPPPAPAPVAPAPAPAPTPAAPAPYTPALSGRELYERQKAAQNAKPGEKYKPKESK
jgi:hypothetical protein